MRSKLRGKRQEVRGKRQEVRGKKQEVRGKKQEVRGKRIDWLAMLCAAFFILHSSLFISCKQEDDRTETVAARHWVEKTVAVVAPIGDAATKARLERTASWFLDNFREAQMHDTLAIDLKIAWYDELSANLAELSTRLASDSTVVAVIGPFSNEGVAEFAPACMKTQKPLIAPTATSEDVIRQRGRHPPLCRHHQRTEHQPVALPLVAHRDRRQLHRTAHERLRHREQVL